MEVYSYKINLHSAKDFRTIGDNHLSSYVLRRYFSVKEGNEPEEGLRFSENGPKFPLPNLRAPHLKPKQEFFQRKKLYSFKISSIIVLS